ncbi:MAG TPA: cyclase family protein [Thermoplasmata archaeon]|nr:cyclase family protein [Thermoplasmata archaeon]
MSPIDISMPIRASMPVFPGDPATTLVKDRSIERGDPFDLSVLTLGTHSGTHLDPPSHFLPKGASVDAIDLAVLNGPCRVVRVPDGQSSVFPSDLAPLPPGTERVLFRTSNSRRWAHDEPFFADFVDLSPPAAKRLIELGVRLVGIDALSIESDPTMGYPVHRSLLSNGVVILEGVLLDGVDGDRYTLHCLPLRIVDGDGGPCRAVLDAA